MAFYGAHDFVVNSLTAVDNNHRGDYEIKEKLKDAACLDASYNSAERCDPPKCHPDTRKEIIKEIMEWVNSNDPRKKMTWFNGSAGAGKSAIAQTICERCSEEGKLLSSFFLSRTSTTTGRDNGSKLVPTIAYHLATVIPEARASVVAVITEDPGIFHLSMEVQLNKLIINPIQGLIETQNDSIPYLVVIDGLDECHEVKLQSRIINLVSGSPYLKIFIASRPETEIEKAFDAISLLNTLLIKTLNVDYRAQRDVEIYLNSEFDIIKKTHILKDELCSTPNWPSDYDIWYLLERSSGHFIYAATVMKYVSDENRDPPDSLEVILQTKHLPFSEEKPFSKSGCTVHAHP